MEAESVAVDDPWKLETSISGYTGSGYLRFDGNEVTGGPAEGFLSYHFYIQTAGKYTLTIRSNKNYTEDPTWSNDCYTQLKSVDTGTNFMDFLTKTYAQGRANSWNWNFNLELENGNKPIPTFDLPVGEYELIVAGRR